MVQSIDPSFLRMISKSVYCLQYLQFIGVNATIITLTCLAEARSIFVKHYKNVANNSTATTTLNRKQSVQVSDTSKDDSSTKPVTKNHFTFPLTYLLSLIKKR
jgi:hypothetical protein